MFARPLSIAAAIPLLALGFAVPVAASQPGSGRAEAAPETVIEPGPVALEPEPGDTVSDDSTHLEEPEFPTGLRVRDAFRFNFESRFVPEADIGPGHVTLYRPDLRARLTVPVSDRMVVRASGRFGMSSYAMRGSPIFTSGGSDLIGNSLDVYRARIGLQGAVRLNDDGTSWLANTESWALLASLTGESRWESGAFSQGLKVGTGLAIGYEAGEAVRAAIGVSADLSTDSGDVSLSPFATFRWNVTEGVTLRNRGLGLQVEYRWSPTLELFVTGFRKTDSYRLDARNGFGDELKFRDRQWLAGTGFEWKLNRHLRFNAELGAVAWRRVSVSDEDLGTLSSHKANPTAYVDIRVEFRP